MPGCPWPGLPVVNPQLAACGLGFRPPGRELVATSPRDGNLSQGPWPVIPGQYLSGIEPPGLAPGPWAAIRELVAVSCWDRSVSWWP